MVGKKKNNEIPYLAALRELRGAIGKDYKDGGWLPAVREMSERLNVSKTTYCKAVRCLEEDGIVHSYSKKGSYVIPEMFRVRKIGLIIANGSESPMLRNPIMQASILQIFKEHGFFLQLIQAADNNTIQAKALIHGVEALMWLYPSKTVFPVLNNIQQDSALPLLAVSDEVLSNNHELKCPLIMPDGDKGVDLLCDFFIKRRHKKVAYVITNENQAIKRAARKFKDAGVDMLFGQQGKNGNSTDLSGLAEDYDVTGLYVMGNSKNVYDVFSELANYDRPAFRDVFIYDNPVIHKLAELFPKINITAVGYSDSGRLGEVAAEMMINHLVKGEKLESKTVFWSTIKDFSYMEGHS